jgi:hypothetical protein
MTAVTVSQLHGQITLIVGPGTTVVPLEVLRVAFTVPDRPSPPVTVRTPGDRLPGNTGRKQGGLWHAILGAESMRLPGQVIRIGTSVGAIDLEFERERLVVAHESDDLVKHVAIDPACRSSVGGAAVAPSS